MEVWGEANLDELGDQIRDVLQKGGVKNIKNKRACIMTLMEMEEVKEVCQERRVVVEIQDLCLDQRKSHVKICNVCKLR